MAPTRYRQIQSPVSLDVANNDTGASTVARQLSDSFANFANTGADIIGIGRAQQGAREGEAAGAAGNPKPRTGLRAVTSYGQAYNSAAEAAYQSKVQTDIDTTIDSIEQGNEGNLEGFEASAKGYADELIKSSPAEYRIRVQQTIAARVAAGATRVRGQQIAKQQNQQQADVLEGMQSRANIALKSAEVLPTVEGDAALVAAVSDNKAQLDVLVKDGVIDATTALKWQTAFHDQLDKGILNSRINATVDELMDASEANAEKGDAQLAKIMADPAIPQDQKELIFKGYKERNEQLSYERSRTHAEDSVNLAKALAAEDYGPVIEKAARGLYQRHAISLDEYQSAIAQSMRNEMKHLEDGADVATIDQIIQAGGSFDPNDPKIRKAVGKWFDIKTAAAGVTIGDPRWQAFAAEITKKTNVVPETAEKWARVSMLSGDPTQAALGASFMKRIQEANKRAWDYQKDPKIAAFADQLNANLAAGIEPTQAYKMADDNVYQVTPQQREQLNIEYRKSIKDDGTSNADALQSAIEDDATLDAAMSTPAMRAEYENLVSQYYTMNDGDLEGARKLAAEHVKTTYGVTRMNGEPQIIKYAPEAMYPGLTPEIIRADVAETLKQVNYAGDPKEVSVVPTDQVGRTKGAGGWLLVHTDEDGNREAVLGPDNLPVAYDLPLGNDYERLHAAELAAKLTQAYKDREEQRRVEASFEPYKEGKPE